MKKYLKIYITIFFLLTMVVLTGIFFQKDEDNIDEKVFLAMIAQGVHDEEPECLKARAILLRSNLVAFEENVELATPEQLDAFMRSDYNGSSYRKVKQAIKETKGMILVYEKTVVFLPYHGVSCGRTRDAGEITNQEFPYIKSASCKNDILSDSYIQVRKYSKKEFPGKLQIIKRFSSGYVDTIAVGDTIYTGEEFRALYNLPSACFFIEDIESGYRILIKGNGHGVGMSLNMANELAKNGYLAMDILNYFFMGLSTALYEQGEVCPY